MFFFPLAVLTFEGLIIYFHTLTCLYCLCFISLKLCKFNTYWRCNVPTISIPSFIVLFSCQQHDTIFQWIAFCELIFIFSFLITSPVRTDPEAHMVHVSSPLFCFVFFMFTLLSSLQLFCRACKPEGSWHMKNDFEFQLCTRVHLSRARLQAVGVNW